MFRRRSKEKYELLQRPCRGKRGMGTYVCVAGSVALPFSETVLPSSSRPAKKKKQTDEEPTAHQRTFMAELKNIELNTHFWKKIRSICTMFVWTMIHLIHTDFCQISLYRTHELLDRTHIWMDRTQMDKQNKTWMDRTYIGRTEPKWMDKLSMDGQNPYM